MKNKVLIALSGNPNAGKTTLFNALTGAHHQVGNYPGVTVEKRAGSRKRGAITYHFVDLPGIYSLTAYSEDEVVSRDFILDEKPDLILDVLDSTNLERNLYLCLQMQELGIPVISALNMSDEADKRGIQIDEKLLSATLGIPFVKITAQQGRGIDGLLDLIDSVMGDGRRGLGFWVGGLGEEERAVERGEEKAEGGGRKINYGGEIESRLEALSALTGNRWLAIKLLEKDKEAYRLAKTMPNAAAIETCAAESISWIEKHFGKDSEIIISEQRYGYIHGAVSEAVTIQRKDTITMTQAVDKIFMHRMLALPIFIVVLWLIFQLTFSIGAYPQEWLETFFSFLSGFLTSHIPAGLLRSLLVGGIISGVGGVLSFVPLIVILFLLLSILEDLGYMSRAAFATDKLLHSFGLHGQSIFPMMLGFGCSVPAVMSSRTLKSKRDRIITVLVTPMMSCGAKLPIHLLLAAAFFPKNAGNMVMLIYACGVVLALSSAFLLRKTVLKGDPTPFVMELPPYRLPTMRGILWHVWEKTISYVKKAGTIILASAILVWAITSFPRYELSSSEKARAAAACFADNPDASADVIAAHIETVEAEGLLEHSIAGSIGKTIEPVFKPLGFNWKMAISIITGFTAKEVVVSTLGILYHVGGEEDEESVSLQQAIAADPTLTPLTGFVFMLFMLVIPPCFAALATIKGELGGKWLAFEFAFLLVLGWLVSFVVHQVGSL
ncbi:MAG: ferrous iron transport protein B [Spirochaetaceae bacterium]|jgi:ferrous iron transport protein B|nr:ferrous iron transport protein B [Spirochaetaceae bacterium]